MEKLVIKVSDSEVKVFEADSREKLDEQVVEYVENTLLRQNDLIIE